MNLTEKCLKFAIMCCNNMEHGFSLCYRVTCPFLTFLWFSAVSIVKLLIRNKIPLCYPHY